MHEELLIRHCAPTLAGIKTGSLFLCPYQSKQDFLRSMRCLNCRLGSKGLRALPLRFSEKKVLVYVYRPKQLCADLAGDDAAAILKSFGYDTESCEKCLVRLAQKLRENGDFPHEIGLFLGYPAEDVRGFMENGACGCKCVGCWKVYGDPEAAKKKFAQYKKCTRVYCDCLRKGSSIERLTVPT